MSNYPRIYTHKKFKSPAAYNEPVNEPVNEVSSDFQQRFWGVYCPKCMFENGIPNEYIIVQSDNTFHCLYCAAPFTICFTEFHYINNHIIYFGKLKEVYYNLLEPEFNERNDSFSEEYTDDVPNKNVVDKMSIQDAGETQCMNPVSNLEAKVQPLEEVNVSSCECNWCLTQFHQDSRIAEGLLTPDSHITSADVDFTLDETLGSSSDEIQIIY